VKELKWYLACFWREIQIPKENIIPALKFWKVKDDYGGNFAEIMREGYSGVFCIEIFIGPYFYFSTLGGILGHHSLTVLLNFPINLPIQKKFYQHLRTPPQNKKELKRISELEKNPDCIWIVGNWNIYLLR
jgi:hypothetical protein